MNIASSEKNYVQLLTDLKQSLESAIAKQQYHRLMEIDKAVRICTEEAVASSSGDEAMSQLIADRVKELMRLYKLVAQRCSEKSVSLQADIRKLNYKKKGAQQYLSVSAGYK